MALTIAETLNILIDRRYTSKSELADKIGMSRQNLSNKFSRNSFSYDDVQQILAALNCHIEIIMNDSKEKL